MYVLRLAVKNVFRKAWRSLITAVPVLIGVHMIIFGWGLIDGVDQAVIFGQIKSDSGHFRVMAKGYLDEEEDAELDHLIDDAAAARELVAAATPARLHPRLAFRAELSDGRNGLRARGLGVDPEAYFDDFVLPLESRLEGDLAGTPLWIGATLAADFGVAPGDVLTVLARTRYGSYTADEYTVAGLIRSQNPIIDSVTFFIPLASARALLDCEGAASELVGVLPNRAGALDLPARLGPELAAHGLEIQTWRQRAEPILRLNRFRRKALGVMVGIIVLVAATGIANTTVMAAFERVREIGALRALGLQVEGVVALFLVEALLIGVAGAAAGCGTGAGLVYALRDGIDLSAMTAAGGYTISMSTVLYFELEVPRVILAFVIGVSTALAAALYPAVKFSRLSPMEAMRG